MSARPRLRLPSAVRAGEVVEVRALVEHPMETGLRRDGTGQAIARDILARFVVRANGETVFTADFRNGTSANPYLVFFVRVERTTEFEFLWTHETGGIFRATGRIDVS
jgi:sulfur-oxidizing protein SoxZ